MNTIILIILIVILIYYYSINGQTVVNFKGTEYKVLSKYPDYKIAVEKLAGLNDFIIVFMRHLKAKHRVNLFEKTGPEYVFNLLSNFRSDKLTETDPNNIVGLTSYTFVDGRLISVCLRDKKGKFINDDMLKFVIIHELAHQCKAIDGHGDEFWTIFKFLLEEAEAIGYYSNDYKRYPEMYVSIKVDFNPRYDLW
jgi:hypothetical protein